METLRQKIRLHHKQAAFCRSRAAFRAFVGGRGAGKSWCGAYDLIRRARPGLTYLVGSPTGVLMGDTTFPTFKALARDLNVWGGVKLTPYPNAKLILEEGDETASATVRFRTADDPERMRGPNLAGAWLDEASLMREDAFNITIGCLREGGRMGWLSATFTPRGPTHWTHEVFARGAPDTALFRAKTADNPFLAPEFEATIRRRYGDTQFARQELGGEFVSLEGVEFPGELFDRPDRWFSDWPPLGDIVARVVALDPSKGARDDGDYQAFAVVALDCHGTFWADAELHRETVTAMVARGFAIAARFGPLDRFVVEDNDGLGMLVTEFRRQSLGGNLLLPFVGVRNTVNKVFRVRRLGGYLAAEHPGHGLQVRFRDTAGGRLLVAQLRDFPLGEHDDGPDALEMAVRVLEELVNGG